jgi:putative membrane protein
MDDADDRRIFFAAERSLLAWNRTCLAMMGFGFVIDRFGPFLRLMDPMHPIRPLGSIVLGGYGADGVYLGARVLVYDLIQNRRAPPDAAPDSVRSIYRARADREPGRRGGRFGAGGAVTARKLARSDTCIIPGE